ncbi:MAG TPA: hypothetical protein DCO79_16280 [Spirochaeta sp.]|nr:hypothetical protein [Spirochaeta sp.]
MLKNQVFIPSVFVMYIFLWTGINFFLLISFPFMHSDESWLAGLSRAILLENTPAATEPFFNLVTRAPHAIKIFFHGLQILFIKIFGYNLFSIRLLQLLTGSTALFVFGGLLQRLKLPQIPGVIILSVQIQFIYASHFGRQEIQILLLMLLSLSLLYRDTEDVTGSSFRRGLIAGIPIAAAIGFHPNAFIAAWPAGLVLLYEIIRGRRRPSEGLGYLMLPAASAVIFVMLSLSFSNSFVSSYGSFGEEVGVLEAFDVKLLGFDDFYRKLFLRVSGTYYTPRIWPVFIIAAAATVSLILTGLYYRVKQVAACSPAAVLTAASGIAGVNIGILVIGKYSAPAVVFVIPFLIILISAGIEELSQLSSPGLVRPVLYTAAAALLLLNSVHMIMQETGGTRESYDNFTQQIRRAVPPLMSGTAAAESRVLGPLTAGFAFEYGRLLDWRNLTALRDAGLSLDDYIRANNVEYIIYTEEFDLIYKQRPVWNVLYGNPTIYHEELQDILNNKCELISEFASPGYGTRIVLHREKKDWFVRVYSVR